MGIHHPILVPVCIGERHFSLGCGSASTDSAAEGLPSLRLRLHRRAGFGCVSGVWEVAGGEGNGASRRKVIANAGGCRPPAPPAEAT
jgi:hypothetical protein